MVLISLAVGKNYFKKTWGRLFSTAEYGTVVANTGADMP